jgi:hypothetical protein
MPKSFYNLNHLNCTENLWLLNTQNLNLRPLVETISTRTATTTTTTTTSTTTTATTSSTPFNRKSFTKNENDLTS